MTDLPPLPADEATDAEGPRGTYGCACLHHDAVQCAAIRYGMDHWGEACECLCHQWGEDDDDLGADHCADAIRARETP